MRGIRADEASVLRRIASWPTCYEKGFELCDYQALVDLKALGRIEAFTCPFEDCPRPARRHFRLTDRGLLAMRLLV